MSVILYSTGCPKCTVLKKKLEEKGIDFKVNDSVDEMTKLGMTEIPMLFVDDKRFGFMDAVNWANSQ